jgi:hypothetical protein
MPPAFARRSCGVLLLVLLSLAAAAPAAAQSAVQKVQLLPAGSLAHLRWSSLATDPQGDGLHPRLPDAKELSYAIDAKTGRVWFKVNVYEPLPEGWFGFNVAIRDSQLDGNADHGMTWWGTNKFKFDRLASAYLYRAEGYWQGVAGVADSEGAGRGVLNNLNRDVQVALDRDQRAIFMGVPRSALGSGRTLQIIATVGSMLVNNDDLPNEGAITLNLPAAPGK